MRLSIIIPVYNAEKTLDAAISSALSVTEDMELILVDDGSQDESLRLMEAWAQKDSRVRAFHQQNAGAGAARNRGLAEARGEYVAFMDADDLLIPAALLKLLNEGAAAGAQLAIGRMALYESDPEKAKVQQGTMDAGCLPHPGVFAGREMGARAFALTGGSPVAAVFERRYLESIGLTFCALRRSEDIPFACTAIAAAERILCTTEPVYLYWTGNSASMEHRKDDYPDAPLDAIAVLCRELEKRGLLKTYRAAVMVVALRAMRYNLTTLSRGEACQRLVDRFLTQTQPLLGIVPEDLADPFLHKSREYLQRLMNDGSGANYLLRRMRRSEAETQRLLNSTSYRLGRKITAIAGWLKR